MIIPFYRSKQSAMQAQTFKGLNLQFWFSVFLSVHVICWTLVPALIRYNLPLDAIEGTIWGHQLEWGYDKNPFLNGWLTALAVYLGGSSGWMIYLFSQLSVASCFWVIWKLGKHMLTPAYALVAVFMLEGLQYFNFHALDFNDNTLELGLWALCIYFFYQALSQPKNISWILTGFFAALGMMAKYYTAALLAAMFLLIICDRKHRKQLTTRAPYFGILTFLLIILPHTIWLFFHDFVTVTYVFGRASSPPSWTNHFFYPAQFAWQQLQVFIPVIVLGLLLCLGKKPALSSERAKLNRFDRQFLFYVGLGPFLLTILLSFLSGIKLRAGWGMPLLSLWTILWVAWLNPQLTKTKLKRFIIIIFSFIAILLVGYTLSIVRSSDESSGNFPGREMANTLTRIWHDTYHTPLNYVAGSRWLSGNIEFYSADHPDVFIEWNNKRAPWIQVKDLEKKGGIFLWDVSANEKLPNEVIKRYPQLTTQVILTFDWKRNINHLAPIRVGIALLPPAQQNEGLS